MRTNNKSLLAIANIKNKYNIIKPCVVYLLYLYSNIYISLFLTHSHSLFIHLIIHFVINNIYIYVCKKITIIINMLMRRFLNWWRGKSVKGTGKELQHHIDTYKIYTLARDSLIANPSRTAKSFLFH